MAWDIGSLIGKAAGAGIGEAVSKIATPFTQAWTETKKAQSNVAIIDKQTDRDITVEAYRADVQLGLGQRLLSEADRSHWSTRWIRPTFAGLSCVWIAMELWFYWRGFVSPVQLNPVVTYLLAGIVGSVFLLRPYEKRGRTDIAVAAQANASRPTLLQKIGVKKV